MTDIVERLHTFAPQMGHYGAHAGGVMMDQAADEIERLRAERDHARACKDNAVRLLVGIHSLMYPAPVKTPDGRTMVFRPNDPDPHAILQALSDRTRALPDELASIDAAMASASEPTAKAAD